MEGKELRITTRKKQKREGERELNEPRYNPYLIHSGFDQIVGCLREGKNTEAHKQKEGVRGKERGPRENQTCSAKTVTMTYMVLLSHLTEQEPSVFVSQ